MFNVNKKSPTSVQESTIKLQSRCQYTLMSVLQQASVFVQTSYPTCKAYIYCSSTGLRGFIMCVFAVEIWESAPVGWGRLAGWQVLPGPVLPKLLPIRPQAYPVKTRSQGALNYSNAHGGGALWWLMMRVCQCVSEGGCVDLFGHWYNVYEMFSCRSFIQISFGFAAACSALFFNAFFIRCKNLLSCILQ